MCGIAGLMTRGNQNCPDGLAKGLQLALQHRGPDGQGAYTCDNVLLVHTRLSIIDLKTGDQPLFLKTSEDDAPPLALVANGEIYNAPELRAQLPGAHFQTLSDCEPPLHLYVRDGLDFVDQLCGMYALALHDPGKKRLVLARDPFGIKPLYYAETPLGFCFASEPEALLQTGLVERAINADGLSELLQLQFTTGRETAFRGVFRLLPGEALVVEEGRITERYYRDFRKPQKPNANNEAGALAELDEVFEHSVRYHQRSDVGYGMFFSGGIDSSALLAMMERLNPDPVIAFTVGFDGGNAHDERTLASLLAAKVGAEHHAVSFGEQDFWDLIPKAASVVDDPTADYAILPTLKLAALAKDLGLKVILSGEGGDELFAGYGRYRKTLRPRWMGGRPMRDKGIFDGLGLLKKQPPKSQWRHGILAEENRWKTAPITALQRAQFNDCANWLPNDLLTKLDRCLMAHGIEGRVPFLDEAMADFAFYLPDRLKAKKRKGKWLLRQWLATAMPLAKPFSKKRGFTVPVESWIAAKGPALAEALSQQPFIRELCDLNRLKELSTNPDKSVGKAIWTLTYTALWYRCHIEGKKIEGDTFAALHDIA